MTAQSPSAWIMSFSLHAFVAAIFAFIAYTSLDSKKQPTILELVAGEGDNYMATVAPALGEEGGVTVAVPKLPAPRPVPPEPVIEPIAPLTPEPPPLAPAPPVKKETPKVVPKETSTKAAETVPNFDKQLKWAAVVAESKLKLKEKREKEAEKKRLAAEKKRQADEAKKMTKAEFDKKNKAKVSASTSTKSPVKVAKIDEGIAKGVAGGSSDNKIGGARGTAMTNDNADVMAGYYTYFREQLRHQFEPPPGLSDTLKVKISVQNYADGRLGSPKVIHTSGSREFDRAVLDAIRQMRLPPRPDRKSEEFDFIFTMKERNE